MPKGVSIRKPSRSNVRLGKRFSRPGAMSSLQRFQRAFPSTKIRIPRFR